MPLVLLVDVFVSVSTHTFTVFVLRHLFSAFFLYGTIDREYIFQRSYDLKNWEQISTGKFMKFEDGNPSGRNVIYSSGMGPQAYWRLVYK